MQATNPDIAFARLAEQFRHRAEALGLDHITSYYWYHTLDLGDGLIAPGMYDYRETVSAFQFPQDMRGLTALDIGSATGFFAFEFERRGARVVSVELPSLQQLDRFPGQSTQLLVNKLAKMLEPVAQAQSSPVALPNSPEQLYFLLLEGPFRFCHQRLRSSVSRCYSTVYDLSAERLGAQTFDWVFLGDILLHTINPLRALAAVAPLCSGTLVLSQIMPDSLSQPAMLYVGGEDPREDDVSWWWPNKACLEQILKKLGFRTVREVGCNRGVIYPAGHPFERPIIHARK